jgi:predicted Holliday junction resolvase-like endonuclease
MYQELASGQYIPHIACALFLILFVFEFLAKARSNREIQLLKENLVALESKYKLTVQTCENEKELSSHWFNQTKALEDHLQHLKNNHDQQIDYLKTFHNEELLKAVSEARADSNKRQRAVIRGQATEHLAPFIQENYAPKDYRFIGDPIDYLICVGASAVTDGEADQIEKVVLMDVKTGKSQLNKVQRRIRNAIAEGRVEFQTFNPETNETRTWKNEK